MLKGIIHNNDDKEVKELLTEIINRLDKLERMQDSINHKLNTLITLQHRLEDVEANKIEELEQDIIEILEGHGRLYIRELINLLGTSNTTLVYKALKQLERKAKITYETEGRKKYILLNI